MKNLKEYELFKEFSNEHIDEISRLIIEKEYEEDEIIFKEGEEGDALYIVSEGEVAIRRFIGMPDGKRKTLAIIEKGNFFGEMAIFDNKPRSASAFASIKSRILILKKNDFWNLIYKYPDIAISQLMAMNRVLSERLRIANYNFITAFEIGRIMATVNNMKELFDLTLEQLSFVIEKSDASFCALYDEFSEDFKIISRKGVAAEKINEEELTRNDSIVKDILLNQRAIYIENTDDCKKYSDLKDKSYDGKSVIISPIIRNNKLLGILFVLSFKEYNAFNQANKLLLGTVARQIGPAIEDLKHREEEENRKRLQERRYSY